MTDFKRGKITNPYHANSMQSREWLRGFNTSFYQKLEKVKKNENRRRSEEIHER